MRRSLYWAALVSAVACGSPSAPATGPNNSPATGTGGNPLPSGSSISIVDYGFSPGATSIKVGSSVAWTNNGSVQHTATADMGTWNSGQLMGSSAGGGAYGGMSAGGSFSFTFAVAGTYTYHCANHSQMTGTITVTP